MSSPHHTPQDAESRRPEEEVGMIMEQAARSSESLYIDANAAQPTNDGSSSSPLPSRTPSPNVPSVAAPVDVKPELERRASYAPTVSSPLNPSLRSSNSVEGSEGKSNDGSSHDSSASDIQRSKSASHMQGLTVPPPGFVKGRLRPPTLSRQLVEKRKSMPHIRAEEDRYSREMGRDYSRYPGSTQYLNEKIRYSGVSRGSTAALLGPASSRSSIAMSNPFNDSELAIDQEKSMSQDEPMQVFNPYYAGGGANFILFKDEIEDDDDVHMPHPDDDTVNKPKFKDHLNNPRAIVSAIGGLVLVCGLLVVFIAVPILDFGHGFTEASGNGTAANSTNTTFTGPAWAHVNDNIYPLIQNVRKSLVDPDTPESAMTRKSTFDDGDLNLVFSDEFNEDGRTFYSGDDPFWTAADLWYGATQDLEWYDPDAVSTSGGTLRLKMDQFENHNLQFRSGMLNSWNQMCFKGGVMEVSLSLAGPSGVPGLWPGVWSMGNLGRPGYRATTDGVWPYTYNFCDQGITPNQSSPDGTSFLPGQRLASCTCDGADHPNPGTGRGAPEIDVIEASVDYQSLIGVVTQSFQVAPFDVFYRPNANFMQIPNVETTRMNPYCGGPYQQAISGVTLLNNEWYNGSAYQKYAFEYVPGTSDTGKLAWFVGDDQTIMMDGRAIGPNGNVASREISQEPMSLILNLGISNSWSYINWADLEFPTYMDIDYVRIYQKNGSELITCDPPGYPTTEYIKNHPNAYNNVNLTLWNETGYDWPSNQMTSNC